MSQVRGPEPIRVLAPHVPPYRLFVLPDDHISNGIVAHRRPYEERLLRIVAALTKPGDVIFDVGANIGNHSVYWALTGRHVVAFEPNPVVRTPFLRSIVENSLEDKIVVHDFGLSSAPSQGTFNRLKEGNLGAMAVEPSSDGEVRLVRLDDVIAPAPAAVKIDVEGHEADVIDGALETIQTHRPLLIAEELTDGSPVLSKLRSLGYLRLPCSLATTPTYLFVHNKWDLIPLFWRDPGILPFLLIRTARALLRPTYRLIRGVAAQHLTMRSRPKGQ